jgi:hypothetical protein
MKKALAGPAKPAAKKQPERRGIVAAARGRIARAAASVAKWNRRLDRAAKRRLRRAQPTLARWARRGRAVAARWAARVGKFARPAAALLFRGLARAERRLRALGAVLSREAMRASAVVTPRRAICAVIVASAACLVVSQFVDYRGVQIGQIGYAGLPAVAAPPTVGARTAGQAHSYLLIPLALLAAVAGVLALQPKWRGLGRVVVALGLLSIAVILLVDLPAGLDAGAQTSRFAGASAVLEDGFYAELAAAAGLVLGGLLYYARPCRIRINLSARVASALRRRPRRQASSRVKGARRGSRPRKGAASAPASRP